MNPFFFKKILQNCLFIALLSNGFSVFAQSRTRYLLDGVHNNPGEALTTSEFNDPAYLKRNGYNGQVFNDFIFAHAAVTFDRLNPAIFPKGSVERAWVIAAGEQVKAKIVKAHKAGLKAYFFTDLIVLPKKLVELYHDQICDKDGNISFERPKTVAIHRLMLRELFEKFPDLDGLVIRTGETYLNNVPYHTGNNPITNGVQSHVKLLNLLREEVCVKFNKTIFYRTWSFGGMHDEPAYYQQVVEQIKPHKNLIFSIKHTKGDYHRNMDFNPTLAIGKHPQIVEVQCQREYEGKGAYPNYVMDGVINGFEEFNTNTPQTKYKGLKDIANTPQFSGIWSWSRGGGWVGPYITNEFWCKLNAYVISHWAADTKQTEEEVFDRFMDENGISGSSRQAFRALCLKSAQAVLRGHNSALPGFDNTGVWWMRDEFLGGINPNEHGKTFDSEGILYQLFETYYKRNTLQQAIAEKYQAVALWQEISQLTEQIVLKNKADQEYIKVSSQYGLLLHEIIAEGWNIMAIGFTGDHTGDYHKPDLAASIKKYDDYWHQYQSFKDQNPSCATLYKPYAFVYQAPDYHDTFGMGASIDKYRKLAL